MPAAGLSRPLILATSVPPGLRGQALNLDDPASLQARVLASWRPCCRSLLSIHTQQELRRLPHHAQRLQQGGVEVLAITQPASSETEHLPNLHTALCALVAAAPANAQIALTNADILLADQAGLIAALERLCGDQFLIARRTNVAADRDGSVDASAPPTRQGSTDRFGFDFFACRAERLRQALPLIPPSLVFGRPWWDLFFPLALLATGAQPINPGSALILHPHHEERWSAQDWYRHGHKADRAFLQLLHRQGPRPFAQHWARQRRRAILRWPGLKELRHRLREQRRSLLSAGRLLPLHLSELSDAINNLLDGELAQSIPYR